MLSIDEALSAIEAMGDAIDQATSGVVVDVSADVSEAESSIDGLDADTVEVPVEADTSDAAAEIGSLEADTVEVPVDADVSEAESEIASIDAEPVEVEVTVNTGDAEAQLAGVTEQVETLGGSSGVASQGVEGLEGALGAASISGASAALGYAAIGTALVGVVSSAAEAEGVLAVTTQTIENMGEGTGVTIEGVQALATGLLETAGVSDEATIAAAGLLARYQTLNNAVGEGNDIFDRTLLLGADVARILGTDITGAADLLGKAIANPEVGVGRLARRFPQLTEAIQNNIVELQQSGDLLGAQRLLLDTLEGSVEGVAEAYGDSLAGQLDIAKESMGELAEAAGGLLAPAVTDLAADMTELFSTGSGAISWANETIESTSGVSDAMGTLGDVMITLFTNLNPIGLASNFRDLVAAIATTGPTLEDLGVIYQRVGIDVDRLREQKAALTDGEDDAASATEEATAALAEQEAAFQQLTDAFLSNAPEIGSAIQEVEGNLNGFGQTIDSETDAQMVIDNFGQMIAAFQDFATNIDTIGNVSSSVAEALAPLGPEIAGGFVQALADGRPGLITQLEGMLAEAEGSGIDMVDLFGLTASDSVAAVEEGLSGLAPTTRTAARDGVAAVNAERSAALQAGTFLGNSFTTGTRQGSRDMRVKTKESAREAIDAVRDERDAADRAGDLIGSQFSIGTRRGARDMRPNSREAANSAIEGVKELTQAAYRGGERVGENLASGIAAGISSGTSRVTSAAVAIVNAAAAAANAAARSSSPSKVFEEIGWNMSEGMAIGLADTASVVAAAEALTLAAVDGSSGGTVYGDSNVNVTVDARGATDPQAVGDAVGQAVEDAMFRAAFVGGRRRR